MTLSASLQRCRGLSEGVPWNVSAHYCVPIHSKRGAAPEMEIDRSFYTKSMDLSKEDFEIDDDDSDDDFGIGAALKFIVIIVTYRHPVVRQRRIRLPALLRLLVYST